jgi:hypothetical protein
MPYYDAGRDAFIRRIDRRRRRAILTYLLQRGFRRTRKSRQATVYDACFTTDLEAVSYYYATTNDHMPDFDCPELLNEKIRWQFLHHPNPLMSLAADKIAVRRYLNWKGATVQAPELLAVGEGPDQLARRELPERFALKSAFGSGQNHFEAGEAPTPRRVLTGKVAFWNIRERWRKSAELHYRPVPKRWLVEELLPAARQKLEYRVHCMMGEPVFLSVITERNAGGRQGLAGIRNALFDPDWRPLSFGVDTMQPTRPAQRPDDLDLMLAEARRLAEPFLYVRVDFLKFDDRLTFSELTFAPMGARIPLKPFEVNRRLGALIDLDRAPEYLERGRRIAAELGWRHAA